MRSLTTYLCAVGVFGTTISGAHRTSPEQDWNYRLQGSDWHLGPCSAATIRQSPVAFEFKHIPLQYSPGKSISIAWDLATPYDYEPSDPEDRSVSVKPHEGENFGHVNTTDYKVFDLIDIHFHAPGEHTMGTDFRWRFPIGADLVHKERKVAHSGGYYEAEDDGEFLVIGVLFTPDKYAHKNFAGGIADAVLHGYYDELDFAAILNKEYGNTFLHYEGSLTTPPCTENVRWYVLREPVKTHPEDIAKIAYMLHDDDDRGNFRCQMNLPAREWNTALLPTRVPPYPGNLNVMPVFKAHGSIRARRQGGYGRRPAGYDNRGDYGRKPAGYGGYGQQPAGYGH